MALINNGYRHATIGRRLGGRLLGGVIEATQSIRWNQSGSMDNSAVSEAYGSAGGFISYPDDVNVPYSWKPPQVAGRMVSINEAVMSLSTSGFGTQGLSRSGLATMSMATTAQGAAIANASGLSVMTMTVSALTASAILNGSGAATMTMVSSGNLFGIASASGQSTMTMTATMVTGAIGRMVMTPISTALTPSSVADAVWSASAAANNTTGTMGEKLNDAGAAGNPWAAVVSANNDAGTFGKLVQDTDKNTKLIPAIL